MKAVDFAKRTAANKLVDYLLEDPETNMANMVDRLNTIMPGGLFPSQREAITTAVNEKNNWYQLLVRISELNPEVIGPMIKTFLTEDNLIAWGIQEKNREKYDCNIPWAILLDPTSACNLHCTGCWAADYGHSMNLSFEDLDSIIEQGKELGTYIYIYSGGEPLVRKDDIIKLCEKHPDCMFLAFTNGTLIDEDFCQEMIRVKNFIPAISSEGDKKATDSRRGDGTFDKVEQAMDLLRSHGLPFGVSVCYTSENADSVASEEYIDYLIDEGALFAWIFTYMPVGQDAPTSLMPTPDQREMLYNFNRRMRDEKPLFTLDFQHDGEFVGGCIAGGRRYLHINAAGDVEPCVFIHYSNVNIHDTSLLDALHSPIFMAYYENQPFNENYLRPCPMYENPECLEALVEESGAESTHLEGHETAHELSDKCRPMAAKWAPVAERIWTDEDDPRTEARKTCALGMADSDKDKFKKQGRVLHRPLDENRDPRSIIEQREDA